MDGKNVADFIDPDILEKLEALEREEAMLEAEGYYDDASDGMVRRFDRDLGSSHANSCAFRTRTISSKRRKRRWHCRRSWSRSTRRNR